MVKYAWIFATILALIFSGITTTEGAKKQEVKTEVKKEVNMDTKFGDTKKIISCIHTKTLETRDPHNETCYFWPGWQNIVLPSKSDLKEWQKVFETDAEIINRLPIVNFESWFDINASNSIAKGYVQTLKSYKIPIDIVPQLTWMKARQESQKKGNCSQWSDKGETRMMRCLYARHYGALKWYHWYPNKAIVARAVYKEYLTK